jgi:hypothetical protein
MSTAYGIALGTNQDERLELFATSGEVPTRDAVWHSWEEFPTGDWTRWQSLGGPPTTINLDNKPLVERNGDGRLEVFILDRGNAVWHAWQRREGGWSDWESLGRPGGPETGAEYRPAVARNHDGRLELFTVARVGTVWHRWQGAEGGWSAWSSLGRPIGEYVGGTPAAAQNKDGRLEVFAMASDGAVWHRWQRAEGGGWSAWSSLGGGLPAEVTNMAVTAQGDGRLVLFVTASTPSPDNSIFFLVMRQQAPEGDWSPWFTVGEPAAAPWDPHPGGAPVDLAAALRADGCLRVFVVLWGAGSLYEAMQVSAYSDNWNVTNLDLWRTPTGPQPPSYEPRPAGSEEGPHR